MKLLALLALILSANAHAGIYKCGTSYSPNPCEGAVIIEPAKPAPTQTSGTKIIKVLTGKVTKVADGDTITLDSGEKIRFAQIDTPEISHFGSKSQPYGKEAGMYLRQIVMNQYVKVEVEAVDQYGRNVGTVYNNLGYNINRELVKNGFAWAYRQYLHDTELLELEKKARAARIGLWSLDDPIYPPDFRKHNK
jgi:endonuclease YncB( thermonuclease family)